MKFFRPVSEKETAAAGQHGACHCAGVISGCDAALVEPQSLSRFISTHGRERIKDRAITAGSRAFIGDRETVELPPSEAWGRNMGGKSGLEENWRQQAEALKREVQNLPKGREREEVLRKAQIRFDAPAVLRKWPSSNGEHLAGEIPDLAAEGSLGECIALFASKPMSELQLYEIHTAPQGELITAVLSAQQIIELAGLWGFV
jgi:hypothetical protein